jgi:hypothetical protein
MNYDPKIIAAGLTILGSIILAVFSLVTSGKAMELALKAKEAAKRSEQVRLNAVAAGEKLLKAMAKIILEAESAVFLLSHRREKELSEDEEVGFMRRMGGAAAVIRKTMYSTAIYTTPAIRNGLYNLLRPLQEVGIGPSLSAWESLVAALRAQLSDIAALFHDEYLK